MKGRNEKSPKNDNPNSKLYHRELKDDNNNDKRISKKKYEVEVGKELLHDLYFPA